MYVVYTSKDIHIHVCVCRYIYIYVHPVRLRSAERFGPGTFNIRNKRVQGAKTRTTLSGSFRTLADV